MQMIWFQKDDTDERVEHTGQNSHNEIVVTVSSCVLVFAQPSRHHLGDVLRCLVLDAAL